MAIDSKARKGLENLSVSTDKSGMPREKTGPDFVEMAANLDDSQQLLLRAQQNAVNAKEAAMGAISRFYQESQASEKKAEKMVRDLDDAIQIALDATQKSAGKVKKDKKSADDWGDALSGDKKEKPISEKVLNNSGFSKAASGLTKTLFGGKEYDEETRAEFYRVVMRQSPQLRQLIDDLTEDKAKLKTEKIMNEAKSEIVAARVAVNHAQEEVKETKEAARKTMAEAEIIRKTAEITVSQVKQGALSQIAAEITKANDEVRKIKESADEVVRRAEEEIRKSRDQTAAANNHAQVAISLAQEKLKKDAEQVKEAKLQAQLMVKQSQDESRAAKEEAEIVRRQAQEAINRATLETKVAQENIELAKKKMQEATVVAEKQAYDKFCDEVRKIREDAEAAKKTAYEAIAKAREESNLAKAEAETMKKASEEAMFLAQEETRKAHEEAESARKTILEAISRAQEDSRKKSEEAEATILQANEAMMQAKQDIINMTRKEISQARQDLELASNLNNQLARAPGAGNEGESEKLDPNYVATVLHEMRTPLHSISGFAKLMLEDNVGDSTTQKEFLSLMVQQSESLNRLIDDLSGLLRNQDAPFSISKEPVSSAALIEQAIDGVQTIAQQKKNLIRHEFSSELPVIEADPLRIKQVIVNLLTNAIKFSPSESTITVKAGVLGDELLIQVNDRGSGIPETEIPYLFSGSREASSQDERQGEGLGLTICRQIIEAHGGNIWAESQENKGSTFSFTLPLPTPVK